MSPSPTLLRRAVGALAVAVALVACGDAFAAPAAIVNGHEISQAALEQEVEAVFRDPEVAGQLEGPDGADRRREITRNVLSFLIQSRFIAAYAEGHGLGVSDREVDDRIALIVEQSGGREEFDAELSELGLTEGDLRRNVERSLLLQKVQQGVVGDPQRVGSGTADEIFTRWFLGRVEEADIEVNPRFGRLEIVEGNVTVAALGSTEG